jgi:hypothetical protein
MGVGFIQEFIITVAVHGFKRLLPPLTRLSSRPQNQMVGFDMDFNFVTGLARWKNIVGQHDCPLLSQFDEFHAHRIVCKPTARWRQSRLARAVWKMSRIICGVSLPVKVFCWLGWKEARRKGADSNW